MEWKIYVVSLGKYNAGKETGCWFTFPVSINEIEDRLGMDGNKEEVAIHDYELPFKISEYENITELNNKYYTWEDSVEGTGFEDCFDELINYYGSFDSVIEHLDVLTVHHVSSLEEYLDYERIVRDLEINGNFIHTKSGIVEIPK